MRTYEEICEDLRYAEPGPEARKLHKELKAYGDGLSLWDRYPEIIIGLPLIISVVAAIIALLSVVTPLVLLAVSML